MNNISKLPLCFNATDIKDIKDNQNCCIVDYRVVYVVLFFIFVMRGEN